MSTTKSAAPANPTDWMASPAPKFIMRLILEKERGLDYSYILTNSKKYNRSTLRINNRGNSLILEITAKDTTALRASANSVLRDMQIIEATRMRKPKK